MKGLLLLALFTAGSAQASDWVSVGKLQTGAEIFIDRSSIDSRTALTINGIAMPVQVAWIKFVNPKPVKKVLTTVVYYEISCEYRLLSNDVVIQHGSRGDIVSNWTNPYPAAPTIPVAPDTGDEDIFNYLCSPRTP